MMTDSEESKIEEEAAAELELVVRNFAEKLLSRMQDLPAEYAEIVDKHFWELV